MTEKTGYGNPPKETQFKKGTSGNPKGRPKRKSLKEDVLKELSAFITINENGQSLRVTRQNALVKRMIAEILSGNMQAMRILVGLLPPDKNPEQNGSTKFVLNLGDPKIRNRVRLNEIEKERAKLRQELEVYEGEADYPS